MRKTFKRFSRTILEQGFTAEASVTFDDEASKWVQTKAELTFGDGILD